MDEHDNVRRIDAGREDRKQYPAGTALVGGILAVIFLAGCAAVMVAFFVWLTTAIWP